ncbi:MAG TPA: CpsB/CapC family capsule biosynthesis tyrosine phosphatase [Desulfuromonadaceae bacterium]
MRDQFIIDWHTHILPGLDDGSPGIEQSLAMAGLLAAHGFTTVYCTPHQIRGCYEASNDQVRRAIAELQQLITANDIPLTLLPGREYYLDEYLLTALEDPLPLGDSRQVLVEIPSRTSGDMVRQLFYAVVRSGFTPVIAHPERCTLLTPSLQHPEKRGIRGFIGRFISSGHQHGSMPGAGDATGNPLLDYLRDLGCSFQGNLGSFNNFYGRQAKTAAETLRNMGVYDRYGSDLHSPEHAKLVLGLPNAN